MSNVKTCDLCTRPLMEKFEDPGYQITVKRLKHSYDGYNPWIRKTKLDVCHYCISEIRKRSLSND